MNKPKIKPIRSAVSIASALSLLFLSILPAILGPQTVYAATFTNRKIQMSSSNPGGAATYAISFTTATAGDIEQVVVDFCANTPIIGASCTAPTGFGTGYTSTTDPTVTNIVGLNSGTWATSTSTANTLILTNSSATTSVAAGTAVSFDLTSATNPTTLSSTTQGTFYARMLTYSAITTYSSTAPGTYTDEGGDALSVASELSISATVQEALDFCVYLASSTCGTTTPISFQMGHLVGGVTVVDSSAVYTTPVDFSLTTNAISGAAVNLYGGTLTSGTNTIPPVGATATGITAGTAAFGIYLSTLGTGVTASSPYSSASTCTSGTSTTSPCYALDTNTTSGTLSTYGETIATMSGPENSSVTTVTYGVTASNTTPAGVYTATHQLIATGTF